MIEKEWHENGQLKSETVQVDGRKEVIYSEWHKNGNIAKKAKHKKNIKIEESIFNDNGKPISKTYFSNHLTKTEKYHYGNLDCIEYYKNIYFRIISNNIYFKIPNTPPINVDTEECVFPSRYSCQSLKIGEIKQHQYKEDIIIKEMYDDNITKTILYKNNNESSFDLTFTDSDEIFSFDKQIITRFKSNGQINSYSGTCSVASYDISYNSEYLFNFEINNTKIICVYVQVEEYRDWSETNYRFFDVNKICNSLEELSRKNLIDNNMGKEIYDDYVTDKIETHMILTIHNFFESFEFEDFFNLRSNRSFHNFDAKVDWNQNDIFNNLLHKFGNNEKISKLKKELLIRSENDHILLNKKNWQVNFFLKDLIHSHLISKLDYTKLIISLTKRK